MKTEEQAAREYAEKEVYGGTESYHFEDTVRDFLAGCKFNEEQLNRRLQECEKLLMGISNRHKYHPGFGECICPWHKSVGVYFTKYKESEE